MRSEGGGGGGGWDLRGCNEHTLLLLFLLRFGTGIDFKSKMVGILFFCLLSVSQSVGLHVTIIIITRRIQDIVGTEHD